MDVVKLIRAVRSKKPLWDRKHAYYHDRIVTMGLWNDVAISLGTDPDSARAKWKGLRDTFRGELKKVNKTIASGTHCRSTNWEYFDEMLFVKDQIYSNRRSLAYILQARQRTVPPTADSSIEESNASVDVPITCKQEVIEENEDTQGGIEDDPAAMRVKIEPQPSIPPPQVHSTDDDYNFLMSILPQLRNLPTMRNLYVRLKIQELLYNEIVSLQDNN